MDLARLPRHFHRAALLTAGGGEGAACVVGNGPGGVVVAESAQIYCPVLANLGGAATDIRLGGSKPGTHTHHTH